MSNRVILQGCTFNFTNGTVAHGYTISDDYGLSFDSNAEGRIEDDLELLKYAKQTADRYTSDLFDDMRASQKGILINDTWYDWDEVKDILG